MSDIESTISCNFVIIGKKPSVVRDSPQPVSKYWSVITISVVVLIIAIIVGVFYNYHGVKGENACCHRFLHTC